MANPFRYRGYYYDTETGYYYLNSRYYNPQWGRFLNADGQINGGILGKNLFAYCYNNPIMFCDCTGKCAHTYTEAIHCENCLVLIRSGTSYPKASSSNQTNNSAQNTPDYEAEQIQKKNDYQEVNDADIMYWGLTAFFAGFEYMSPGTIPSTVSFGIVAAVDIFYYWNNPNLKTHQKVLLTVVEVEFAVLGILGTAVLASTPAAPFIIPIGAGYSLLTYGVTSYLVSWAEEINMN